jgi:hypothetical protein
VAGGHLHELAGRVDDAGHEGPGLDRDTAEQPADRRADLPPGESDERVGAEDRRIVAVERVGSVAARDHRSSSA